MKIHTTNYTDAFIEIAEDCKVQRGEVPPLKNDTPPTIARLQFEIVIDHPYKYTSDDVLFQVFALRNNISRLHMAEARVAFFSKGQACFRASPLTKRYGWGVHSDKHGKIALYGCETNEYNNFLSDDAIVKVRAMKTKRQ